MILSIVIRVFPSVIQSVSIKLVILSRIVSLVGKWL